MRREKRTVAELLNRGNRNLRNRVWEQVHGKAPRHTYVYCRSRAVARRFLKDAEAEGFVFGDNVPPTQKEVSDIFAIKEDFSISYTGWAGHVLFRNPSMGNVVRIDYGKYIYGARKYIL